MSKKTVILLVLLLLLFASISFADYSVSSGNVRGCACSVAQQNLVINNTGDTILFLSLSQKGEAASWSVAVPQTLDVLPHRSVIVAEFVKLPCAAAGTYELKTDIKANDGTQKTLSQKVNVNRCDSIDARLLGLPPRACKCATYQYVFSVRNPASFADTYSFSAQGYQNYAVFTPSSVYLPPGKNATISLFLTPSCLVEQGGNFNIVVSSNNNGVSEPIPVNLDIDQSCALRSSLPANETTSLVSGTKDSRKLLTWLLIISFIIFSALLILALLARSLRAHRAVTKAASRKKILEKERRYGWERIFKYKPEPRSSSTVPRKAFIVIVSILALLFLIVIFINADLPRRNFSINETSLDIPDFVANSTSASSATFSNSSKRLVTPLSNNVKYGLFGLLSALVIFLIVYNRKKIPQGLRSARFLFIAVGVTLFLIAAFFGYQNRDVLFEMPVKNSTLVLDGLNETSIAGDADGNASVWLVNVTAVRQKMGELFPSEVFKTYFPYALAGMLILAIIIFLLLHFEKKKLD